MKPVRHDGERVETDTGRKTDGQRAQHDDGVFRVVDLRPVSDQVRRAHDAEGSRKARADDEHDDGADDRQDDLGLKYGGRARRRAAAFRPKRQRRPEQRPRAAAGSSAT